MDEDTRKRLEYEEQFFGMSSQFFSDCFRKLLEDELDEKITMLVKDLRGKLMKHTKDPKKFELALDKMKTDLIAEYRNVIEKSFPEIELKISNFIRIPPNVLLKEDLPIKNGVNRDINQIKEEIEDLKGTFSSILYLKQKMIDELEEADSAIFIMEDICKKKEQLHFSILPVE